MRSLAIVSVMALLGGGVAESAAQAQETQLGRALNRSVSRINTRADLRGKVSGFDRDSFDVRAFRGLARTDDSTIVRWFEGFSGYIGGTDSTACSTLTDGEPTASALAAHHSTMDSIAVERWVGDWESAVAASYLAPERPKVSDEEMMVAVFALITKLPDFQANVNRKPSDKPRKMSAQAECRMLREFFTQALAMEEPTRMTLLRGLAGVMNERPKLPSLD
jgi:hypothetical protein